jgi:hypothetical protein
VVRLIAILCECVAVPSRSTRRGTQSVAERDAFDFNNTLDAILGYCDLTLRHVPGGTWRQRDLNSILAAGESGADDVLKTPLLLRELAAGMARAQPTDAGNPTT